MSATPANRWKLGAFVVLGIALALGSLVWLGGAHFKRETLKVVTYFDESVQGLDVGSAVKYRGVPIGSVASIRVSPDQRLIEVGLDLYADQLDRLGLDFSGDDGRRVPGTVYAQLASSGLTGLRFVEIGLRSSETALVTPAFDVDERFLPAQTSTMTSVEAAVKQAALKSGEFGAQMVAAVTRLNDVLDRLNGFVSDVSKAALPEQGRQLLQSANGVTSSADRLIGRLDATVAELKLNDLASTAKGTLDELHQTLVTARAILDRVNRDDSPVASTLAEVKRVVADLDRAVNEAEVGKLSQDLRTTLKGVDSATGELGAASRGILDLRDDLEMTLASLRDASDSLRALVEDLRRDPNSLFFGRKPNEIPGKNP